MKRAEPEHVDIHVMRCGACGHHTSARDMDRAKAMMIDHLVYSHQPDPVVKSEAA